MATNRGRQKVPRLWACDERAFNPQLARRHTQLVRFVPTKLRTGRQLAGSHRGSGPEVGHRIAPQCAIDPLQS